LKQIFAVRDNAVPVSRGCSRIHTRARQQYSTDLRPMAYCTDLFLYRPLLGSSPHILPPGLSEYQLIRTRAESLTQSGWERRCWGVP